MKAFLQRFRHKLAHRFGWNTGVVETWYEGNKLMVGFRCVCGKRSGEHEARLHFP